MAAWNEIDFVEQAVRSVINHVDGMVVIEGAFKETVETGGSPRSDDGTIDVLLKLEKEFLHKLKVVAAPTLTQLQHRSTVFDVVPFHFPLAASQEHYWLWLVDADEVYDDANATRLKEILEETDREVVKVDSLTFVNDFKHYVKIAFPRCFKILRGFQYVFWSPNHLAFRPSKADYKWVPFGAAKGEDNREDEVFFFHYSYVKDPARFSQKKRERERVHGQFKWSLDENDQVVCPGTNIRTFEGEHPEIMKTHPRRYQP